MAGGASESTNDEVGGCHMITEEDKERVRQATDIVNLVSETVEIGRAHV